MKHFIKVILYVLIIFIIIIVVFWGIITYEIKYKKRICDTSMSSGGEYKITLEAIGEPDWPFGASSGRLILEKNNDKISQIDFQLRNDGGSIDRDCWKVIWYDEYVEVILSGEEQLDEQIILYFNGEKERKQLAE